MLGHRPHWYWKIMWTGVSPLLLIGLFIFYIINYIQGGTPTYQAWNKELVSLSFFPIHFWCIVHTALQSPSWWGARVKLGRSQLGQNSTSLCESQSSARSLSISYYIQCHSHKTRANVMPNKRIPQSHSLYIYSSKGYTCTQINKYIKYFVTVSAWSINEEDITMWQSAYNHFTRKTNQNTSSYLHRTYIIFIIEFFCVVF